METIASSRLLSVVVSVYNEEEALPEFYKVTKPILENTGLRYELLFVNDGSADESGSILKSLASENPNVRVIDFSRNFGHEAAMMAGVDYARGDIIICMDSDLQHPPEKIPEILEKFDEGYDVVSMIRLSRADGGLLKKISSKIFYKMLNMFSPIKFEQNSSDFFAVSKRAANALRKGYREKIRYMRGYVQSLGFKKTTIDFEAAERVAGESKYSIGKLMRFSLTTLVSFSDAPLRLGLYSGVFVAILGLILMVYSIINRFVNDVPSGYSTIIVVICFMFALLFIIVGIIGQYISVLFVETKNRPIYIVADTVNIEGDPCRNEDVKE